MKKIFVASFIAAAAFFSQVVVPNQAEAVDYYVAFQSENRAQCYVVTETMKRTGETTFEATLKAVFPSEQFKLIEYSFDNGNDTGNVHFNNSDGISGSFMYVHPNKNYKYPVSEEYPVEYLMYQYVENALLAKN